MQMKTPEGKRFPGIEQACQALSVGLPAVVPNPAPMTYSIVAADARSINAVKGRPMGQSVAVSMHNHPQWDLVARSLDLGPILLEGVTALLARRITVLAPLRDASSPPEWTKPAIRNGWLAAFNGYWEPTSDIWDKFPRLYGSSANLTGQPASASAARAKAVFGTACAIVNGESFDRPEPRWASTMVRMDRSGELTLHRSGAQDSVSGLEPTEFLRHLADSVGLPRAARDALSGSGGGAEIAPECEEPGR